MKQQKTYIGGCALNRSNGEVSGGYVDLDGEYFYRIQHHDRMSPFFMSIVSDSNHWMFISSNGALTCGRRNPDSALFPYYTDDKIHDAVDQTGPKTIVLLEVEKGDLLWEPFSNRYEGVYETERNIYKNIPGNKVVFEEINHTLNLSFRYAWMSSDRFGFIRKAVLENLGTDPVHCRFVDGLQNLLPANVNRDLQTGSSTLVDGYKKSELLPESGDGIFSLSSVPVDRAEPSESLLANTVWSLGLDNPLYLLSAPQLDLFRRGEPLRQEEDVRGVRGAYFVQAEAGLDAGQGKEWYLVAEVDQDAGAIADLVSNRPTEADLLDDVNRGTERLCAIVAQADGIQKGGDRLQTARHFANTLFNVMRGGIFDNGYTVAKSDLLDFLASANRPIARSLKLDALPDTFEYQEGLAYFRSLENPDLERLYLEYMPLTFSRRHGDPSRPWNKFSIETRNPDGSKKLSYQGNWRDIFQNWEALGISYPGFFESMVCKFVNASTADGYNPYRITRDGIDWEILDPKDPWSYIGYWGDHQIIYLLKLLEQAEAFHPGKLQELLSREIFVYANVPYRINPYDHLLKNPHESIEFDQAAHEAIMELTKTVGSDGKLVHVNDDPLRVNFAEKLLVPLLAKLSNFIPEAGIWMNTQRPEWNDANNALVGYGVSMVTLYYIRRYLAFCIDLFGGSEQAFPVSHEVVHQFHEMFDALRAHLERLEDGFDNRQRRELLDALGTAGSHYRETYYHDGLSGRKTALPAAEIVDFLELALAYVDQSIEANRREDGLYHAYNLMRTEPDGGIAIRCLYEMLEGQVAVLSSGKLNAEESLQVLKALRASRLYRADQHSYILYPDRALPRFMEKNRIPDTRDADPRIASRDCNGVLHFNPRFRNARILEDALHSMKVTEEECEKWMTLYEQVFDHQSFTGRSGTFFKYEGLGSIYWHMVSKLLLAVQETCIRAKAEGSDKLNELMKCYDDIRCGIGAYKSVKEQGAFPTDPYSHTPAMMGAQQPGLTGQVKEDFIIRLVELGVRIENGCMGFDPFLSTESSISFTICTVPVEIQNAEAPRIRVMRADGKTLEIDGLVLDESLSAEIFSRSGSIVRLEVAVPVSDTTKGQSPSSISRNASVPA